MTVLHIQSKAGIDEKIAEASRCLNSFWPVNTFIACNPLKGFEGMPFEDAMAWSRKLFNSRGFLELSEYRNMYETGRINPADFQEAFERLGGREARDSDAVAAPTTWSSLLDRQYGSEIVAKINGQMTKWCGAFFDSNQSQWSLQSEGGLYASWRRLVKFDWTLSFYGCKNWKKDLDALPIDSRAALVSLLSEIGVSEEDTVSYLQSHFVQLPGWSSHLKWRARFAPDILSDYLAIRLFYEFQLASHAAEKGENGLAQSWSLLRCREAVNAQGESDLHDYAAVWQEAYELNYRNKLLGILTAADRKVETLKKPLCQMVFCIDVRSEPVRRNLEKIGPYATYGFAGFFGFAMRLKELGSAHWLDLCPVLLNPEKEVLEVSADPAAKRLLGAQALAAAALQLRKKLKSSLAGAFGFVEAFGLCSTLPLLGRTLFPRAFQEGSAHLWRQITGTVERQLSTASFCLEEKVALADANLRAIGLTENFSPIVVLCGHKSLSTNNPFASALDCGACGGNSGGYSARFAAAILNDRDVRAGLLSKGIAIPETTIFVAGEHNTTSDRFELFDVDEISGSHKNIVDTLKKDLVLVGQMVREERMARLPKSVLQSLNDPEERAYDWAQIAPEWGLARNAAFIAAPRSMTQGLNLDGRAFLHSYDCAADDEGRVLELIMTAPLVVAQWINSQYYLSTMDNEVFGSGTKVLHNVIGDFGVMQGAQSDLRIGLPLQSVMSRQGQREHEPMRLLALIRAPLAKIEEVLRKHSGVGDLVKNRWIRLVAVDPDTGEFFQAEGIGQWKKLSASNASTQATCACIQK